MGRQTLAGTRRAGKHERHTRTPETSAARTECSVPSSLGLLLCYHFPAATKYNEGAHAACRRMPFRVTHACFRPRFQIQTLLRALQRTYLHFTFVACIHLNRPVHTHPRTLTCTPNTPMHATPAFMANLRAFITCTAIHSPFKPHKPGLKGTPSS